MTESHVSAVSAAVETKEPSLESLLVTVEKILELEQYGRNAFIDLIKNDGARSFYTFFQVYWRELLKHWKSSALVAEVAYYKIFC